MGAGFLCFSAENPRSAYNSHSDTEEVIIQVVSKVLGQISRVLHIKTKKKSYKHMSENESFLSSMKHHIQQFVP